MPPPNLSQGTAIAITALPYSIDIDPDDPANDLWWSYTAPDGGPNVLSVFAWTDATNYRPRVGVWQGEALDDTALGGFTYGREPLLLPVTPGTTYYIQIGDANATTPLGGTLELSVQAAPADRYATGALFIPSDSPDLSGVGPYGGYTGLPASIHDPETGDVLAYVPFPASERADILPSGHILAEDSYGTPEAARLYDRNLELVASLPELGGGVLQLSISTDGRRTFYVLRDGVVHTVSAAGVVGSQTWDLGSLFAQVGAPSRAGTVFYYTHSGDVRRWDLTNDTALSDLAGVVSGYATGREIIVLADETILVGYGKGGGSPDYFVRRYDTDGTILQTYSLGTDPLNHLARAVDETAHFWVWCQPVSAGVDRFSQIDVETGDVLITWDLAYHIGGALQDQPESESATRFGHSFSCPFLVLRSSRTTLPSELCCPCDCPPKVGRTGTPSSGPLPSSAGPTLPPVDLAAWDPQCTGGGDVPTAADASDAESWVS